MVSKTLLDDPNQFSRKFSRMIIMMGAIYVQQWLAAYMEYISNLTLENDFQPRRGHSLL